MATSKSVNSTEDKISNKNTQNEETTDLFGEDTFEGIYLFLSDIKIHDIQFIEFWIHLKCTTFPVLFILGIGSTIGDESHLVEHEIASPTEDVHLRESLVSSTHCWIDYDVNIKDIYNISGFCLSLNGLEYIYAVIIFKFYSHIP